MKVLGYALQEALISLKRGGRSAGLSIGTIAVAFLTLGSFLLISTNLQSLVDGWAAAAELSIYLADDMPDAARQALADEVSRQPAIAAVEFVSKDEALARFRADFPELADMAASGANPFPSALEVRMQSGTDAQAAGEALARDLAKRPGVTDVRYDREWLARLLGVARVVRLTGFAVAAVFVLGAAFTVAAVVRLALLARRDELEIMQLVGAPYTYIRGPFVAAGTLLGGLGAIVALLVLWVVFVTMRAELTTSISAWTHAGAPRFLGLQDALSLIGAGLVVGGSAGVVASRAVR
jgi:cell division transport system permease protein